MIELFIFPLVSAGGIKLNSTRDEVHSLLGEPSIVIEDTDQYQETELSLSVDYGENGKVEYISISKPNSSSIKVIFHDFDVFNIPAEQLIEKIENETPYKYDRDDPERGYSYIFQELELSFWRPTIPENKTDHDGMYFEVVGIGIKGYYD